MTNTILGALQLEESTSKFTTITVDGDHGAITLGGKVPGLVMVGQQPVGYNGQVSLIDRSGNQSIQMLAKGIVPMAPGSLDGGPPHASVKVGGAGATGEIAAISPDGKSSISLQALGADASGHGQMRLQAGGGGADSEVDLFASGATTSDPTIASICLRARDGSIRAGGGQMAFSGIDGLVEVVGSDGKSSIRLETNGTTLGVPPTGNVRIRGGGNGSESELALFGSGVTSTASVDAAIAIRSADGSIRAGVKGVDGRMLVCGKDGQPKITLDGASGDIFLSNADCAEEFDVAGPEAVEAGTVMVFDQVGALRESNREYDRKVAGVVSGAGAYRPGIVMDKRESGNPRLPVALLGKTYCKVDAAFGAVEVGDLLTSSATPGHAMKAEDPYRAFGAVIGKALSPLKEGRALIPILIALQ